MPGTLGEAIHDLRTRRGLSQGALARAAGCSRSFLSLLESGRRAAVTLPLAHRLAQALGVPVSALVTEVTAPEPVSPSTTAVSPLEAIAAACRACQRAWEIRPEELAALPPGQVEEALAAITSALPLLEGTRQWLSEHRPVTPVPSPLPDGPYPGAVFAHRTFRWSDGRPREGVVLVIQDGMVTWALIRPGGGPKRLRHRTRTEEFVTTVVGQWLPSPAPPAADPAPQASDPLRVGAVFLHQTWRWADGRPRRCIVLDVSQRGVTFAVTRGDLLADTPTRRMHTSDREVFAAAHLGRWVRPRAGRPAASGRRPTRGPEKPR